MLALFAIVFAAFVTEATVGFGSTILTVTLGGHLREVEGLLAVFVPLNVLLSALLLARSARLVEGGLLARVVLPPVGAGMLLGMLMFRQQGALLVQLGFGLFVVSLALIELGRTLMAAAGAPSAPLSRPAELGMLALGGLIHGLFGSGGPVIVYVLSRRLTDRSAMRATLSALWLGLNVVLVANYAAMGRLTASSLRETALLLPALGLGLAVGNRLHHRLPERPFRLLVYVVLLLAGGSLAVRTFFRVFT